jgi:hypothetical protein
MENMLLIGLALYLIPMIANILFVYSDKEVKTIGDLMVDNWWTYFVPFLNLCIMLMIPIYYLIIYIEYIFKDRWENFKNTKIK